MNKFLYILKNRFDVQIKDETSVLKYIEAYPNCNIDVTYAVTRLRDEFGNNADIVLELRKMCFDNQMLVIIVRQKEYSDDIMTILDKISDELDEDATEFLPWILLTTDFHRIEWSMPFKLMLNRKGVDRKYTSEDYILLPTIEEYVDSELPNHARYYMLLKNK